MKEQNLIPYADKMPKHWGGRPYALQSIELRYLGPTDTKGARVSARCDARRKIYNWDHRFDATTNFWIAGMALLTELGWDNHDVNLASTKNGYVMTLGRRIIKQ